jgi:hypothetical protein
VQMQIREIRRGLRAIKNGLKRRRGANLDGEVVDGRGGGGGGGGHAEPRGSGGARADEGRRGTGEGGGAGDRRGGRDSEARVAVRQQRGGGGCDDGGSEQAEAGDERSRARRHLGSESATALYIGNRGYRRAASTCAPPGRP